MVRSAAHRASRTMSPMLTFSGNLALSFSRSSTIEERTCATLWCGISTLLTRSERSLRSRSTTFST